MAMRNFANGGKVFSMHIKPVITTATIQIGASGAVSSFTGATVASVTNPSTGLYTITLQASTNFNSIIYADGTMQSPSSGLSGIGAVEVQNAPNSTMSASSGGVITFKTLSSSGSLASPASGSALNVIIIANDSSVLIGGE